MFFSQDWFAPPRRRSRSVRACFTYEGTSDFHSGFTSRPKLPCSPDIQSLRPGKGKIRTIAPQFSQSGPQQTSRPGSSGSSTRSRQSSQSSRK
ncbi:PREDICTED: lisH domain-containing protein ARMC9-like [Gekko japonicus]|uniref:LisH domain-containing protein ARMC9-like n=1 Tax=Gekko japonicus TaxID=146911 RepID=A0ABM1JPB6_GEKJA|nr:PREDICTED: lisH domain-containing protein ARMC9-like [Gekko japonicus]